MSATFDFTAVPSGTDGVAVDLDLMEAPPLAPASMAPVKVSSIAISNPLLVTSLPEIDTDEYALKGHFVIHRTGSAELLNGALYSSHYTQSYDLAASTISSITPLASGGESVTVRFSTPQPYLLVAGTAVGLIVNDGDTLNFTMFADHVQTTDKRETINLGAGDDWVLSRGGSDTINGGAGLDTSAYDGERADFTVAHTATGFAVTDADFSTDTLIDVERLEFSDGRTALDIEGSDGAGAVYRIYQAAFDRTPDIGGLTFWVEKADLGLSTTDMAARFMDSDEFRTIYGSSAPPATSFVDQLYENVLHRAADAGGESYWAGQIGHGMSEAEVLARFADSAENRADVIGIIGNGIALNTAGDYTNPDPTP